MEILYMYILPDHVMDYISTYFTTKNRLFSIFKSNQIREPIPGTNLESSCLALCSSTTILSSGDGCKTLIYLMSLNSLKHLKIVIVKVANFKLCVFYHNKKYIVIKTEKRK